jgi:hypothetical protein
MPLFHLRFEVALPQKEKDFQQTRTCKTFMNLHQAHLGFVLLRSAFYALLQTVERRLVQGKKKGLIKVGICLDI